MPSPFPGMNPYFEQDDAWHKFHEQFCIHCMETLVAQIGDAYVVNVDEHIYIHEIPGDDRRLLGRADVSMAQRGTSRTGGAVGQLEAPAYGDLPIAADIERESYIEIRDRRSRELITVIELLSPANKRPGPDREQYLAKRNQIAASSVNFVEIDLLRGGPRLPIGGLPPCDYYALVSPPSQRPRVGLWPIQLRDPLPPIPIPLSAGASAELNLQQLLHNVYDRGGYANYLYDGEPQPALSAEHGEWAKHVLAQRARK